MWLRNGSLPYQGAAGEFARRAWHESAPLEDSAQSDAQAHLSKIRGNSVVSEALDFRTKSYKMTSDRVGWGRTLC
jgi:hypothetical protein